MSTTTTIRQSSRARRWTNTTAIQPRVQHSVARLFTINGNVQAIQLVNSDVVVLGQVNIMGQFCYLHMDADGEVIDKGKARTAFGFDDVINRAALR